MEMLCPPGLEQIRLPAAPADHGSVRKLPLVMVNPRTVYNWKCNVHEQVAPMSTDTYPVFRQRSIMYCSQQRHDAS